MGGNELMEIPQASIDWNTYMVPIVKRFDREVAIQLGEKPDWELPEDVSSLPFWQEYSHNAFREGLGVPFYQLRKPKKRENCLDLGCGVSFLIYPWVEWEAYFYGHDFSDRAVKFIKSRAPQLNSKLFKSMQQGPAHRLDAYQENQFDLAIATGFLYYYPLEYFSLMWHPLRRILKPKSLFVFDVVDPETRWVDEWGLGEIYKETEPVLTPLSQWEALIKQLGGKVRKQEAGELFVTYSVALPG